MNETIIEADKIPKLFLKITKGLIHLFLEKISAKGLIIMTKETAASETAKRNFINPLEKILGVKTIIGGSNIKNINIDININISWKYFIVFK